MWPGTPVYLSDIPLDVSRIDFTADISEACSMAETLLVVVPSPFLTATFENLECRHLRSQRGLRREGE